jgi:uncharacterized membrane protein YfcA
MVSMSLLPLFMGIKQAAVISTVFALWATLLTFARHYREYNWRLGAGFLASVVVGLPLGLYVLEQTSEELLVRIMGGLMLAYAMREFLLAGQSKGFPKLWTIPLGLFSGAISGAFNLGGVPSAAYAYAQPWSRGQVMGFLQVMITSSCLLRILFYRNAGLLAGIPWRQALWIALPLTAALCLGHFALQRIAPQRMRQIIFVFIGISGFYYLLLHGRMPRLNPGL